MRINKKQSKNNKKIAVIATITVTVIVLGFGAYIFAQQSQKNVEEQKNQATSEEIKKSIEEAPVTDGQENTTEKTENVPTRKIDVVPIIASYELTNGQLDISGMVTGLVDAGGTCTVTVSWGNQTRSGSSEATAGPSSTTCAGVKISVASIPDTEPILVKLTYVSSKYTGESSNNPTFTLKEVR